ncbi:MAG: PilC/PilY family type IV pilus protein, partial [Gammaproteobacteria bacterium]
MNKRAIAALLAFAGAVVFAAATFLANSQPYGYIAPPALNSTQVARGGTVAYTPWFERITFKGDLLALPVASNGVVDTASPLWKAATVLDGQNFSFGRRIVTTDGSGTAIPFRFASLTAAQQGAVGSETLLNYIRGDRIQEGVTYRTRSSVLGAIIHSGPVYVQKAVDGYADAGYLSYAVAQGARSPRVYVGANDGMLHAFDANTGAEVFAYIPSMVVSNLPALAVDPYSPTYYVDGALTTGDVYFGGAWHTVLVGGLGAGGKGFYALDITDANAGTEAAAAAKILWEFQPGSVGAANLGYAYSRPSIVKLNTGQWAAVVANGYLSGAGAASLLFLDIQSGVVIRELIVTGLANNGLSSPTLIDTNGDRTPDVAYAGDLNGNLWKFDISSASAAAWGSQLLFQTDNSSGVRQPISTAPDVGFHPEGGYLVYVATGRLFDAADGGDKTQQAVYGIWDNDWATGLPIAIGSLLTQQLIGTTYSAPLASEPVRTVTAYAPDWITQRGWRTPLEIAAATVLDQGERVVQDIKLSDDRVQIASVNPTVAGGENWYLQLDALTGGAPSKTILDLSGDYAFNVIDNADGDGDGSVSDTPEDRVVGEFQGAGLMSRAVIARLDTGGDTALINHLALIGP